MSRTEFSHRSTVAAPLPIEVHMLAQSRLDGDKVFYFAS